MKEDGKTIAAKFLGCAAFSVGASLFLHWQNNGLMVTRRTVRLKRLPAAFDGLKIAHLSDLHGKVFGVDQQPLIHALKQAAPDIIVITGDLVDKRRDWRGDFEAGMTLVHRAVKIAPVYYVAGNHEWQGGFYRALVPQLIAAGVHLMDNQTQMLTRGDAQLLLMGMADPASITKTGGEMPIYQSPSTPRHMPKRKPFSEGKCEILQGRLKTLCTGRENICKILLSHRPNLMGLYAWAGIDLVLCGHAHGGQVRLPVVGGLYAPHQGLFPRYTEGIFTRGATTMEISRGLGNSACPQRMFNRPELVMVRLTCTILPE